MRLCISNKFTGCLPWVRENPYSDIPLYKICHNTSQREPVFWHILRSLRLYKEWTMSWIFGFSFYHITVHSKALQHPLQTMKMLVLSNWVFWCYILLWIINSFMNLLRKTPFHLISWCGNFVERSSFRIISGDSPEIMRKLCCFPKFPHQEIRLLLLSLLLTLF